MRGDPKAYGLAFDEGRRAIASQEAALQDLRTRAGTVVSVAGLTTGLAGALLGGNLLEGDTVWWGAVAGAASTGGFVCVLVFTGRIWRPLPGVFTLDSSMLVGSYVEGDPPLDLAGMHRELAIHLGAHARRNSESLEQRLDDFERVLVAFGVLIISLVVLLLDGVS